MSRASRELARQPRIEPAQRTIEFYDTHNANGQPALTWDQRKHRCYQLAAWALVWGTAPSESFLVHGTIHGPGAPARIAHAWLALPGGGIWEPTRHRTYVLEASFVHWTAAREEARYNLVQAGRLLHARQHFGPWHRPIDEELATP